MKREQREKIERVQELLNDLQKNFLKTYKEIHEIIDTLEEEATMEEWDDQEDGEVDEELVSHVEEIFGDDE